MFVYAYNIIQSKSCVNRFFESLSLPCYQKTSRMIMRVRLENVNDEYNQHATDRL